MLTDRQRKILKAIIDVYIQTAEPVGSKLLAQSLDLGVSSATLRNEMAELINQGYLEQPHTSAGRVPTHKGYRLYVNELMNEYALTTEDTSELRAALKLRIAEYDRLLAEAGKAVSQLTHYAAVTAKPKLGAADTIRHVDIIRCGETAYVVVIVTGTGMVRNRMVHLQNEISESELERLRSAVNVILVGVEPSGVTIGHIRKLETAAPASCIELLGQVIAFLKEIADASGEMEVSLSGAGNLLGYPEYHDLDKARELLGFLTGASSAEWLTSSDANPVTIRIGSENSAEPLKDSSLVVARYQLGGGYTGYIGIVGPTRMNYSRIAARLEYFAKGLGTLIQDVLPEGKYGENSTDEGTNHHG
ncbi:MAG: heat-inducible transcription repressor HrcA [Clostridia bacterium]|nr:heat-inducible transcription repressor HrcA [Clostridia bacterium]